MKGSAGKLLAGTSPNYALPSLNRGQDNPDSADS
jgi:hypothetical protein